MFARNEQNNDQLILVDPVEDEDVEETRPRTDPPKRLTMRSKEKKDYHSSDRSIITFILLYIGFGNRNIYLPTNLCWLLM